jgi:hypothetical protein
MPAASANPAAAKPAAKKQLWPALDAGDDLTTLIARLRAAGFPAEIIRAMIMAEISRRYDARINALFESDASTPFWKQPSAFSGPGDKRMDLYSAMQRERAKLQRELFADPFFSTDDVTAAQRRQFGNLSKQKIDSLQRIEDDYSEMMAAIRAGTNGIMLADDRAKLALLQNERRADLASVLTPQELADYEMRSSPMVGMLSRYLGGFNPTEAEFRAIFQAQQAFSERVSPSTTGGYNYEERQNAGRQLGEQIKAALGDARYADYVRESDRSYQQLVRIAERDSIPSDTAMRAFNVRDTVVAESNRIADDTTMTSDQKRVALQTLAERTRNEILGILGPNAGPSYVKVVDQQFLNTVQRGNAVSFTGTGMSIGMSSGTTGLPVMISVGAGPSYRNVVPSPSR